METSTVHSPRWGELKVYRESKPAKNKVEITVYMRTPEHKYKIYRRDGWDGEPSKNEVDWSSFIMGARSHRFDFDIPLDEAEKMSAEDAIKYIDDLIQTELDEDGLFGFHVEKRNYSDFESQINHMGPESFRHLYGLLERKREKLKMEIVDLDNKLRLCAIECYEVRGWED